MVHQQSLLSGRKGQLSRSAAKIAPKMSGLNSNRIAAFAGFSKALAPTKVRYYSSFGLMIPGQKSGNSFDA